MPEPTYSAVLLTGGKSSRMGRDKAMLPVPGSDLLFWQRQLRVLQELQPQEIFWSGPDRPEMPENIRIVSDATKNAGPLAGITACLNRLQSDLLVVLAIDLIHMNAAFLRNSLTRCSTSRGVVALHGDFYEPLAAIYPKSLHTLASDHLAQGNYKLQELVRAAVKLGLLESLPLEESDSHLFANVNSPADLS